MNLFHGPAAALAVLLSCGGAQAGEPIATSSQTSAAGFDARFVVGGIATELGPVAPVSGNDPGTYNNSARVDLLIADTPIFPRPIPPAIFNDAGKIASHVQSAGIQIDTVSSAAGSSLGTLTVMLSIKPPPGSAVPISLPALSIVATGVRSTANFSRTFPSVVTAIGSASLAKLTVSGQLVNNATLTYAGTPAPNTIMFDSPNLTITLNRQIKPSLISCTPNCTVTPTGITVEAVDVTLHKANWSGLLVDGEIAVARTQAQ